MKIKHVKIENFKGIKNLELDFTDQDGNPRDLVLIVGDNGTGKTSILQAIAMVMAEAIGLIDSAKNLQWNGFVFDRISSFGKTIVDIDLHFTEEECKIQKTFFTSEFLTDFLKKNNYDLIEDFSEDVPIHFENGTITVEGTPYLEHYSNLRICIMDTLKNTILKGRVNPNLHFASVYWFDQFRNLERANQLPNPRRKEKGIGWESGVDNMREILKDLWSIHLQNLLNNKNLPDSISKLEDFLSLIFPDTKVHGIAQKLSLPNLSLTEFYFKRNDKIFEIAELSSGEQAVLSLILDFLILEIKLSIILIDELELHLHPPDQQALLAALPKIGEHCQFILTTHSPYIENVVPSASIIRLEGGKLCL